MGQLLLGSGGCGKTVSPCPCAHSTSRLSSSHRVGAKETFTPLSHDSTLRGGFGLSHSHAETVRLPHVHRLGDSSSTDHPHTKIHYLSPSHAHEFCVGFPHADSGRNCGCHSGFLGAGAIHARGCVPMCSIPFSVVGVCLPADCGHVCCLLWSEVVFSSMFCSLVQVSITHRPLESFSHVVSQAH